MATFYLGMATLFLGLATLFLGIIFFSKWLHFGTAPQILIDVLTGVLRRMLTSKRR